MDTKHNKCCCCPDCTIRVDLCCPCVCPAICVTFTPDNYTDCDPTSTELDWNDAINGYSGSLAGHDLYYYIERDPPAEGQERGPCKFKLRSESLGYPEGYEYEWEIPCDPYDEEAPCTRCMSLETELSVPGDGYDECSGGILSTYCVQWITPTDCDTCFCLCECVCVWVYVNIDESVCSGVVCWDEYEQAYTGTLGCKSPAGVEQPYKSYDISIPIRAWGDVCDPEAEYDCDPYDRRCAIGLTLQEDGGEPVSAAWQLLPDPCQLRVVDHSWEFDLGEDAIRVEAKCALCNETCITTVGCEPCGEMPLTLYFHLHPAGSTTDAVDGVFVNQGGSPQWVATGEYIRQFYEFVDGSWQWVPHTNGYRLILTCETLQVRIWDITDGYTEGSPSYTWSFERAIVDCDKAFDYATRRPDPPEEPGIDFTSLYVCCDPLLYVACLNYDHYWIIITP